jgi:CBS domain-containing protein
LPSLETPVHEALANPAPSELIGLLTGRVRDTYLRRPCDVAGTDSIVSVCAAMAQHGLTHALVHDTPPGGGPERLGIFTTTDLRDAVLHPVPPAQLAVREVARFEIVSIDAEADLFEALWLMVRHRVHRLVVRDGTRPQAPVLGVLGQLDVVSQMARHSHTVALQIDDATTVAGLQAAAQRIDETVRHLLAGGIRVERVARLVGELHARLFARLWALLAPPALATSACLLVMGSEGRAEQLLKTDQDNALLLPDVLPEGVTPESVHQLTQDFSAALAQLGYPPCPGGVMLSRAPWCQPISGFKATLQHWMHGAAPEGPLNLAVFFDARCVAGDAGLLQAAREHLDRLRTGRDIWLARFAEPADRFHEPSAWFAQLAHLAHLAPDPAAQPIDLKKLGLFPLVHGVRALSLQHGLQETGTAARLQALAAAGVLDAAFARDLTEALHLLMALRTAHQLRQLDTGLAVAALPDNAVHPADLSTLERQALQDALALVRRWRDWLRSHFHLDRL